MKFIALILTALFLGCATVPNGSDAVKQESVVAGRIALNWENTNEAHPERAPWSDVIIAGVESKLSVYEGASDIATFCPKFKSLTKEQKLKALGELMVGAAYYESGYKPDTLYRECSSACQYSSCTKHPTYGYCMKGGHVLDGGIVISRGLLQMSLESAQGYGCKLTKPEELNDPIKNLTCANIILARQVERRGSFTTASNYWAVLKSSYKKNKIAEISARVQKHASFCK